MEETVYRPKYATGKKAEMFDGLFEAILSLENIDECYRFFDDLCTSKEVSDMAQRLYVARLLKDGLTYQDIASVTGVSTATISRVKRCIENGNASGYELVIGKTDKRSE